MKQKANIEGVIGRSHMSLCKYTLIAACRISMRNNFITQVIQGQSLVGKYR